MTLRKHTSIQISSLDTGINIAAVLVMGEHICFEYGLLGLTSKYSDMVLICRGIEYKV